MAASVTYQIKGKYDNKAVKTAQADLTAFGKSIKGLGVAAWAKLSTEVIQGLSKVVNGATESFVNQNTAYKKLDASIKASKKDFSDLAKYQDKLSKGNFFDSDSLNNAQAMAINMGLNQKQVLKVMDAAEELTAAGIMPLDQAVKSLALSYSGNTTALSKSIPQMKEFSKEALANGAAIDLVKEKYNGMADAMVNTFSGRQTQFQNSFSDLQASVGGLIQGFKFIGQGTFLKPIQEMTKWIEANRETIIGVVLAIPDLAKITLNNVWGMITDTFTGEGMVNLFVFMGKALIENIKLALGAVLDLFKALFKTVYELFDVSVGNLVRLVKNGIADGVNFFIEKINDALAKVLDSKAVQWIAKNIFKAEGFDGSNVISFRVEKEDLKTWEEASKNISAAWGDAGKNIKSDFQTWVKNQKKNFDEFQVFYEEDNKQFVEDIKNVIKNADIPEDLKVAFTTMTTAIENSKNDNNVEISTDGKSGFDLSEFTEGFETSGILGMLVEFATKIENVMAILNPWQTMLQAAFDVLSPIVNEILAPIVGALKIVGQTIGYMLIPLLQALEPVISLLSEVFVWLYNKVIVPVGNGIITVFVAVKNAMTKIINGLISVINKLPGVNIQQLEMASADAYKLQAIDASALSAAGSVSSTSSSGSSASYTAARDIIVNISFDRSFVNGDATEIAIMLRDEIANAEKLGY